MKLLLLQLVETTDVSARLTHDPLALPRRFVDGDPLDAEVVGLLASAVAYGRVDLFLPRLAALVDALGPHPGRFARDSTRAELLKRSKHFAYRMTGPVEVAALLAGAGALARAHGSLGTAFARRFREAGEPTVQGALGLFLDELLGPAPVSRRLKHLLPHPRLGSACKRLNLFLRWMVRGPDGLDLGLWRDIPASALVIPLDTHVHRIARLLGLTRRTDLSWRTAEEVTARLRKFDPADPVRFDFALSHHGISGDCPARRDVHKCATCVLKPACRAWR